MYCLLAACCLDTFMHVLLICYCHIYVHCLHAAATLLILATVTVFVRILLAFMQLILIVYICFELTTGSIVACQVGMLTGISFIGQY